MEILSSHGKYPPSKNGPFSKHLGFETVYTDRNEVITKLVIEDRYLNVRKIVHGGVLATMLDNIIGDTIATAVECPVLTINLNVNYLNPAKGGTTLIAKGKVVQQGYRIATAEGTIVDEEGTLIARGVGTFKISRPKN